MFVYGKLGLQVPGYECGIRIKISCSEINCRIFLERRIISFEYHSNLYDALLTPSCRKPQEKIL